MPECGGFEVLEILKSDGVLPVIVFVTAYDEYALRAFDAGALDYLLKPFDDSRFALALQRAKERLAAREPAQPISPWHAAIDRKSTRLNSSHQIISYARF